MASKASKVYVCSECSATTSLWAGRCPSCGAWGTLVAGEAGKESTKGGASGVVPENVVSVDFP